MKIVGISDLHGYLPKNLPEGDILCICGDTFPLEYQRDTFQSISWFCLEFVPWTDSLPYKKVIIIAGNHDFVLETLLDKVPLNAEEALKKLLPGDNIRKHKIVLLHNSSYYYEGLRIYGTPYCPDLRNWAFYRDSEGLKTVFSNIPKKCDIILTHCPPRYGNLGVVSQGWGKGENYGCSELAEALKERDFQLLMCGHVHSGTHEVLIMGNSKLTNVSIKDEDYDPFYSPFIIDIYDRENSNEKA